MKSRVAITRFKDCDSVSEIVEQTIDSLDISERFLPQKNFFIKVNLIRGEPPPRSTCVEVVQGIVKTIKRFSPRSIIVGEGAAFPGSTRRMEPIYKELGYFNLALKYSLQLIDLNRPPFYTYPIENRMVHNSLTLHEIFRNIDYVISVPVLKTTMPTVITLGMKNLIGVIPGEIYGYPKLKLHNLDPTMSRTVIDINRIIPISLIVIDGTGGMSDLPVCPPMRTIIAGFDPVATDAVGSMIMGFDPYYIELIRMANLQGMGNYQEEDIEIVGESIIDVMRPFPYPENLVFARTRRGRIVSPIYPQISYRKLKINYGAEFTISQAKI